MLTPPLALLLLEAARLQAGFVGFMRFCGSHRDHYYRTELNWLEASILPSCTVSIYIILVNILIKDLTVFRFYFVNFGLFFFFPFL